MTSEEPKSLGTVLIVGGCGFLGSRMAALLQSRKAYTSLHIIDLRPAPSPLEKVEYHFGDITDHAAMKAIFDKVKPAVVFHTASPHYTIQIREVMHKVNVEGTKTLLRVARETSGCRAFVYTSSASVISDTKSDLVNADETYPYVMGAAQPEYYTTTKAMAEIEVLKANRTSSETSKSSFLTCAVRPSGIFGVGDVQVLPHGLSAFYKGQTRFQLGANDNLFDFTEVTNVVHAHHLAATALLATAARDDAGLAPPLDTERVDGEAFLVTNDSPSYFFDFARAAWAAAGDTTAPRQVWTINREFGLFIAAVFEWIFWALRLGKPNLTRQQVRYSCKTRYFDISKAKRRLGYKPIVSLDAGVKRGVADVLTRGVAHGMPEAKKGVVPERLQRQLALLDRTG